MSERETTPDEPPVEDTTPSTDWQERDGDSTDPSELPVEDTSAVTDWLEEGNQ